MLDRNSKTLFIYTAFQNCNIVIKFLIAIRVRSTKDKKASDSSILETPDFSIVMFFLNAHTV